MDNITKINQLIRLSKKLDFDIQLSIKQMQEGIINKLKENGSNYQAITLPFVDPRETLRGVALNTGFYVNALVKEEYKENFKDYSILKGSTQNDKLIILNISTSPNQYLKKKETFLSL